MRAEFKNGVQDGPNEELLQSAQKTGDFDDNRDDQDDFDENCDD